MIVQVITHAPHLTRAGRPKQPDRPAVKRESPPPLTKAKRATIELWAWARRGAPLASREQRKARQAACEACEFYKATGNLGFGECGAPGCGCSRAKTWLLTAKCPHPNGPRWD